MDVTLDRVSPRIGSFIARYHGCSGKKKDELSSAEEVEAVKAQLAREQFVVSAVRRTEKQRQPAPPFTTSTLQQEASRKLNMAPRRTMSIAQQLYEGVDIEGEGTIGLITYMRTDSLRLSEDALSAARQFITARYGAEYYPPETRRFKAKAGAQDAHEAIRPSNVELTPEVVRKSLTQEHELRVQLGGVLDVDLDSIAIHSESTSSFQHSGMELFFAITHNIRKLRAISKSKTKIIFTNGENFQKRRNPRPAVIEKRFHR